MSILFVAFAFAIKWNDFVFIPLNRVPAKLFIFDSETISIQRGYINSFGTFVCESVIIKYDNTKMSTESPESISKRGVSKKVTPSVSLSTGCINHPQFRNEPVYEFRSGRLIPGYLQQNCDFLPEPGEEILDFKDYIFSSSSRRIYNLPGKFVTRSDYKAEKEKIEAVQNRKE